MGKSAHGTDYLAVIMIGMAGSYARHHDKATAIKNVLRIYKSDFGSVFKGAGKKGDKVTVNVVNVAPHKEVWWDSRGFWVGDNKLDATIEYHAHTF